MTTNQVHVLTKGSSTPMTARATIAAACSAFLLLFDLQKEGGSRLTLTPFPDSQTRQPHSQAHKLRSQTHQLILIPRLIILILSLVPRLHNLIPRLHTGLPKTGRVSVAANGNHRLELSVSPPLNLQCVARVGWTQCSHYPQLLYTPLTVKYDGGLMRFCLLMNGRNCHGDVACTLHHGVGYLV